MKVIIPAKNWTQHLIDAIRHADQETVVVVDSEDKRELARRAAQRMGMPIKIEVVPPEQEDR